MKRHALARIFAFVTVLLLGWECIALSPVNYVSYSKYTFTVRANAETPAIDAALKTLASEGASISTKIDDADRRSRNRMNILTGVILVAAVIGAAFLFESLFFDALNRKHEENEPPRPPLLQSPD